MIMRQGIVDYRWVLTIHVTFPPQLPLEGLTTDHVGAWPFSWPQPVVCQHQDRWHRRWSGRWLRWLLVWFGRGARELHLQHEVSELIPCLSPFPHCITVDLSFSQRGFAGSARLQNGICRHGVSVAILGCLSRSFLMLCFICRFQYVLAAATSPATKMYEETLTYLNQGQNCPWLASWLI